MPKNDFFKDYKITKKQSEAKAGILKIYIM